MERSNRDVRRSLLISPASLLAATVAVSIALAFLPADKTGHCAAFGEKRFVRDNK
jgi:hypothetical protein